MVGRKSQTFPANFTKELMKNKKILIFFRASLGDFYLNFPLFESFRNQKYKGDELTLVTSPLVLDMLYEKKWFDNLIPLTDYKPSRTFDKIIDLGINQTGMSATHKPNMTFFDILESTYDVELNRKEFDSIFRLHLTKKEKDRIETIADPNAVVIHTTNLNKRPQGKTPSAQWWDELFTVNRDTKFIQVGSKYKIASRIVPDYTFEYGFSNITDMRDNFNFRELAYLLEKTKTFVAVDSIVAHLSLSSKKKGIVLWGASSQDIHGHQHNINVNANRPCSPCIDLNVNCCLAQNPNLFPSVNEINHILHKIT